MFQLQIVVVAVVVAGAVGFVVVGFVVVFGIELVLNFVVAVVFVVQLK